MPGWPVWLLICWHPPHFYIYWIMNNHIFKTYCWPLIGWIAVSLSDGQTCSLLQRFSGLMIPRAARFMSPLISPCYVSSHCSTVLRSMLPEEPCLHITGLERQQSSRTWAALRMENRVHFFVALSGQCVCTHHVTQNNWWHGQYDIMLVGSSAAVRS